MKIDLYTTAMEHYARGRHKEAYDICEANQSDIRCVYALGTMYYNGQGVAKNLAKSTECYAKAAEAGIVPAAVSAGFAYANSMGVPEDFEKAAYYLKMAINEPAAKITLAEIYAMGHAGGTRKDAAVLIKEVLASIGGEEAYDVYNRYDLGNV
jgi:hypothetical protein